MFAILSLCAQRLLSIGRVDHNFAIGLHDRISACAIFIVLGGPQGLWAVLPIVILLTTLEPLPK
jgi:hypothetical protein